MAGQSTLQLQKRGVVGDHLDGPGRTRRDRGHGVVHQGVFHVGVAQSHGQVGAAFAGRHAPESLLELLEAHIPQPRQVLAVRHLSVDRDHHPGRVLVHHRQRFLPAGRILGQQHSHGVRADLDGPVPAGDLVHAGHCGHRGDRVGTQRAGGGHRLRGVAPVHCAG